MIAELSKRRVFRVISGYAVICFVILQIADVAFEPLGIGHDVLRVIIAGMLLALPLVGYLSWVFDLDPEMKLERTSRGRPRLEASIAIVAMVVFAFGVWWVMRAQTSDLALDPPTSINASTDARIAVLPLRNLSPDQELKWLVDGLTEQLRQQIGQWRQFSVLPGAFVRDSTLEEITPSVDLVLDGFIQASGQNEIGTESSEITVSLNLISVEDRNEIWSKSVTAKRTDLAELQSQIAASMALFFGESTGLSGFAIPTEPRAYEPFLRVLPNRWMGDADQQIYWINRTLEIDPSWSDGWAELANLNLRNAVVHRDVTYLDKSQKIVDERRDPELSGYFYLVEAYRQSFFQEDLSTDEMMTNMAYGTGAGNYLWLMAASGLHREAEEAASRMIENYPFDHLLWQVLILARANQGKVLETLDAARQLSRLYPGKPSNAAFFLSWVLPQAGLLKEAKNLAEESERVIRDKGLESVQRRIFEMTYHALSFEMAMVRNDLQSATEAADWFASANMHARAGLFYLRLNDPRAAEALAQVRPVLDRYYWAVATMHIPIDLRSHPLFIQAEDRLGFTSERRKHLCEQIGMFPLEANITCDPANY